MKGAGGCGKKAQRHDAQTRLFSDKPGALLKRCVPPLRPFLLKLFGEEQAGGRQGEELVGCCSPPRVGCLNP